MPQSPSQPQYVLYLWAFGVITVKLAGEEGLKLSRQSRQSSCQSSEAVKAVITSIVHIWTCLFRSIQPNAHPYIQYMQYILWRSLSLCYDAGFPSTIRVSSTALGWTHEASLGVYQKTSQIASQRPVWKHLKRDRFLFFNGKPIQLDSYNMYTFFYHL